VKDSKVKALGKMNGIFAEIVAARGKKKKLSSESKEECAEENKDDKDDKDMKNKKK